ncbi:MAG: hypothetical protein M5U18_12965 [Dehalococcoidia bacterium]|nr:hypothetical protein [Dehalococcoidia bacterium]
MNTQKAAFAWPRPSRASVANRRGVRRGSAIHPLDGLLQERRDERADREQDAAKHYHRLPPAQLGHEPAGERGEDGDRDAAHQGEDAVGAGPVPGGEPAVHEHVHRFVEGGCHGGAEHHGHHQDELPGLLHGAEQGQPDTADDRPARHQPARAEEVGDGPGEDARGSGDQEGEPEPERYGAGPEFAAGA